MTAVHDSSPRLQGLAMAGRDSDTDLRSRARWGDGTPRCLQYYSSYTIVHLGLRTCTLPEGSLMARGDD